jgi:hypothetical protein
MELTVSITLSDGDDLGLVGELVALLEGRGGSRKPKTSGVLTRRDAEGLIRGYWADPAHATDEPTWQAAEAWGQAFDLHERLPDPIWLALRAGAELFEPGTSWTATDLAERTGWELDDVRQRLRNVPRSRAVREYVDNLMMRLGLDADDRDVYETVKTAALQFSSQSDGRVVHYTVTPELADQIKAREPQDRVHGSRVDEELDGPPEDGQS